MMKVHQLFSSGDAWAIEPCALETYRHAMSGINAKSLKDLKRTAQHEHEDALAFIGGAGMDPLPGAFMSGRVNNTAVIPIIGMIRPRPSFSFFSFGASANLVSLSHDFEAAESNEEIDEIILYIDSPGGLTSGVHEFAAMVAQSGKRVTAYANNLVASAAYWIASAADEIVLGETGSAGSIGALVSFTDWSAFDERMGIKEYTIVNDDSPKKGTDPASEQGQAQIKTMLNAMAKVFIETVATNRGVDVETVKTKFGQGDLVVGAEAAAVGLVDRLGNFDQLFPESQTDSKGLFAMKNEPKTPTAETFAAEHPQIAEALRAEGKEAGLVEGRVQGAEQERARIKSIEDKFPEAGMQKIVNEQKYNPEATVESVAVLVVDAMKDGTLDPMGQITDDAPGAVDSQAGGDDDDSKIEQGKTEARAAAEAHNKRNKR